MSGTGRYDILFSSDRFNLSEPREYFINDCCYGDDAARWLVERLRSRGLTTTGPDQEDWGWYFEVQCQDAAYFVGVGGNADDATSGNNQGEWRLMLEKNRTVWAKLSGANKFQEEDAIIGILKDIVSHEPGMDLVGVE